MNTTPAKECEWHGSNLGKHDYTDTVDGHKCCVKCKDVYKPTQVQLDAEACAQLIEKYGWIQGEGGDKEVGFCTVGAMSEVTRGRSYLPLLTKIHEKIDGCAVRWNDDSERTKQDVISMFRSIARGD